MSLREKVGEKVSDINIMEQNSSYNGEGLPQKGRYVGEGKQGDPAVDAFNDDMIYFMDEMDADTTPREGDIVKFIKTRQNDEGTTGFGRLVEVVEADGAFYENDTPTVGDKADVRVETQEEAAVEADEITDFEAEARDVKTRDPEDDGDGSISFSSIGQLMNSKKYRLFEQFIEASNLLDETDVNYDSDGNITGLRKSGVAKLLKRCEQ